MSIDWQLTNDPVHLPFEKDWDLKIGEFIDYPITGIDELVQRLKIRLQFFLGELYFDTTQGIPYYQDILKKGTTYDEVSAAIKLQIAKTKNIRKITDFRIFADEENKRGIKITFTAQSDFGEITLSDLGIG